MTIENIQKNETLMRALTEAVRVCNIDGVVHEKIAYIQLHTELVNKTYKSREMRDTKYMPDSIRRGNDLGTHYLIKTAKGQMSPGFA